MQVFMYNFSAASNVPILIPFHPCVYPFVIITIMKKAASLTC